MNIEKQVCSLELAKKLKELGVPQQSLFYWMDINGIFRVYQSNGRQFDKLSKLEFLEATESAVSAFTVAELGEMFGKMKFDGKTMRCMFVPDSKDKDWIYRVYLSDDKDEDSYTIESAGTEADARAKMLIYLIENNLLNVKDIKI